MSHPVQLLAALLEKFTPIETSPVVLGGRWRGVMPNDHYVSRWQIANWVAPGREQVRLFNFQTGRFHSKGPRKLYSKVSLNSPDAELRLNQLLETPLTKRGKVLLDPDQKLDVDAIDDELRNALWLLWSLQPNRYRCAEDDADENLLERSDDELRARCDQLNRGWAMSRLVVDEPLLCLPSSGTIVLSNSLSPHGPLGVPIADVTWAIPVSPQVAFIAHPRGAQIRNVSLRTFITRSAGHEQKSVVVAPALLDRMTEDEVRHAMTDSRRVNLAALRTTFEANAEIQGIAERCRVEVLGKYCVLNAEPTGPGTSVVRHFYVREPSKHRYSVEFLMQNQAVAQVVAKFSTSWSASWYWSDQPRFQPAEWAHDDEVSEDELRITAERATARARSHGYVVVVHAPGRIALLWSDKVLPNACTEETEFNIRAEQPISEGAAPSWWPNPQRADGDATQATNLLVAREVSLPPEKDGLRSRFPSGAGDRARYDRRARSRYRPRPRSYH